MIPALLYIMLKRIHKNKISFHFKYLNKRFFRYLIKIMISISVIMIISLVNTVSKGQQLNYTVLHNGNKIGWIKLVKSCDSEQYCKMTLTSETKFRIVVSFTTYIFETAFFLKDRLVFSSQYHSANGTVKVNKKTKFTDKGYEVIDGTEIKLLDQEIIQFNLLCLYFNEPIAFKKVYCDKHQSYNDIERTVDGGYKVKFNNGNSNIFYYKMGVCIKVIINHPLYSAEVILNQ